MKILSSYISGWDGAERYGVVNPKTCVIKKTAWIDLKNSNGAKVPLNYGSYELFGHKIDTAIQYPALPGSIKHLRLKHCNKLTEPCFVRNQDDSHSA